MNTGFRPPPLPTTMSQALELVQPKPILRGKSKDGLLGLGIEGRGSLPQQRLAAHPMKISLGKVKASSMLSSAPSPTKLQYISKGPIGS